MTPLVLAYILSPTRSNYCHSHVPIWRPDVCWPSKVAVPTASDFSTHAVYRAVLYNYLRQWNEVNWRRLWDCFCPCVCLSVYTSLGGDMHYERLLVSYLIWLLKLSTYHFLSVRGCLRVRQNLACDKNRARLCTCNCHSTGVCQRYRI